MNTPGTEITIGGNRRNLLASLRALNPGRPLSFEQALIVAERQAQAFLDRMRVTDLPVPLSLIGDHPRVAVTKEQWLTDCVSGAGIWDAAQQTWVIKLRAQEPLTRQRMSAAHEFAHILNYGKPALAVPAGWQFCGRPAAEYVADFFAGCLLIPRKMLLRAWYDGIRLPESLAALFDVSVPAIAVRLWQVGLKNQTAGSTAQLPTMRANSWRTIGRCGLGRDESEVAA